jgi:hypothetical protein
VVSGQERPPGTSRRALLSGIGAAAGGTLLAGCGHRSIGRSAVKKLPLALRDSDIAILERALDLERRTVAAYIAGIPILPHPQAKAAEQYLSEELLHTGELISLITAAGGKPGPRAGSYELGDPSSADDVLRLLHSLESAQLTLYLQSIPRLTPGPLRAAVATVLTVDSQHTTMLRLLRGQTPVPSPFVTGAE